MSGSSGRHGLGAAIHVFVTAQQLIIGSAVVPELIQAGHDVTGLARSDASAAAVQAMGAEVYRGELSDPDGLREAVAAADAVIHLAFDHAMMMGGDFGGAVATDLAVVQALGDALAGTGKTFVGIGMTPTTGDASRDAAIAANPRSAVSQAIAGFSDRGVRTILVAVPPVTHSPQDKIGFVPTLIGIARDKGVSGYVEAGTNRWPAVHTLDLAVLFRLALDQAPAGAQLRGAAEDGIEVRRSPRRSAVTWTSRRSASRPIRPRSTSRPSRSSRWTSRCRAPSPANSWAGSRPAPG